MNCPKCQSEVASANINVQADIGKCGTCGHVFKISSQLNNSFDINENFNIDQPPKGVSFRRNENSVVIVASTASPSALFLVPFMLVWSGFSLGGIYGGQIISGEFNIFLSLFGIPFILGTILFGAKTLMAVMGRVKITLDRSGGRIFTGIGPFGRSKRFNWTEVSQVNESVSATKGRGKRINLEGQRRISFGSGIKSERRYYIVQALKQVFKSMKDRSIA